MIGHLLRDLQLAAVAQVLGDARGPETVASDARADAGSFGVAIDHAEDIGLCRRSFRQLTSPSSYRAKQGALAVLQLHAVDVRMEPGLQVVVAGHLMLLAENIARRQWRPLELLAGIEQLRDAGYTAKQIAAKTGLAFKYVQGILILLQQGEQRLLIAVEKGAIPLNAALAIVGAGKDEQAVQAALQDAYESGTLRGRRLIDARRVLERRASLGRTIDKGAARKVPDVTSSSLVRTYQREVERQKVVVRKAAFTQQRLLFVVSALQQLFLDENFTNLLRAEGLATLPKYLAERVWPDGRRA